MTIFNETFSSDKPIYYPSNWQSGKTAPQIYQEWKLTYQFFILTNLVQCIVAALWILLLYVIVQGIKHVWRLYNLPDNKREKIQNRYYISQNFVFSLGFIAFIAFSLTLTFVYLDQFVRYALFKGLVLCLLVISVRFAWIKSKTMIKNYKEQKGKYQSLKKEENQQ